MPSSVREQLESVHPRNAKMRGESLLRKTELSRVTVGRCVERAMERAGIEPKAAAADLGYADPGIFYRWFGGKEIPNIEKLWQLGPMFQRAFIIELATACRSGVRVVSTIEFEDDMAVSL